MLDKILNRHGLINAGALQTQNMAFIERVACTVTIDKAVHIFTPAYNIHDLTRGYAIITHQTVIHTDILHKLLATVCKHDFSIKTKTTVAGCNRRPATWYLNRLK